MSCYTGRSDKERQEMLRTAGVGAVDDLDPVISLGNNTPVNNSDKSNANELGTTSMIGPSA